MNKMIFASVLAVATALVGSPSRAEAGSGHHNDGDELIAAIGGFVGGVIVGSAINNHPVPPPPVAVSISHGHGHGHRHGRWEWMTVRVWVPGRWAYVDRDCGRPRRVWIDGHYDYRRERVWVAYRGDHRCGSGCR